jgi:iron complex outermembrane receptor protein
VVTAPVLLGFATAGAAQETATVPVKLEKIEITGSRIARIDGEAGLPVQIITREEMLDGGMQTMQDLLNRISANQSFGGFTEAQGEGSTLVGFTAASLRGLGSQRTLVLLNGRRLAPYALSGGQSVDLSGIPASALERVEVLKDGASAIYGTDAIGGVINFILRRDFEGVEINGNYFDTEHGGGNNWRASITAGTGDLAKERYNLLLSADYYRQEALGATQRESTKTAHLPDLGVDGTAPTSFPANIRQQRPGEPPYGFNGTFNPTIPFPGGATAQSCSRPYSFPTISQPFVCSFDFASTAQTIPAAEKFNAVSRLTWQVDNDHQFFAEGAYYDGRLTQGVSPTPLSSRISHTPITLPADSPFYPASYVAALPGGEPTKPLELQYRILELGARVDQVNVNQWNGVVGLQGIVKGWEYELAATYTANQQKDHYVSGWVYTSKFAPLLRSGVVDPFGANSDTVLALMRSTQVTGQANDNRASNVGVNLNLANSVYALSAGPVAVAFGIEGRREGLQQSNADFVVSGDVGGAAAIPSLAPVHRTVLSLFGEVSVPIAKSFEANLAVRYDHYSDFGGTTNPKLTLRWQPAKSVVLRGSYGTGFRAPTLSDLFQPQSDGAEDFSDPVRCPVTGADNDCSVVITRIGGNSSLQPETSQQLNAGVVYEPLAGLSTSVDYYWVRVRNVINTVPLDAIFGAGYASFAPRYVVRKPPDVQYPDLPGEIAYVVQYQTNVGTITTSGIDVNLQWRSPAMPCGRIALSVNGTYVLDYAQSGFVSDQVPNAVGARGVFEAIIRYRQYAQASWTQGPWSATLANTLQTGYTEPCLEGDVSGCATRRVGSYSIWDFQARFTGLRNATLALGVRNLLNTPPPVTNQTTTFQYGIDPAYADPRGRMFYGSFQYAFK